MSDNKLVGMYIHQHWPYNHPYAARTWTVEDYRNYCGGLKQLGYNLVMIWPLLEIVPDPPTPSDRANLAKIGKVIDMLHRELGMKVWICLCPNVGVRDGEARKASFEKRHYFYVDTRVNPGDPAAMKTEMLRREHVFAPLKNADAVAIIDSDPGGYPGSTNQEFVNLLVAHRKMFDQLRPGIELVYWMHAGWESYARYYATGKLMLGDDAEHLDCLQRLAAANPAPWGIANGLKYAEKMEISEKVIGFNYGRIEAEPSFPMTNFGGSVAYEGGSSPAPRGVMGNSQTHCVQLPNTFAFVRGALGQRVTDLDYVQFADDLIPGQGRLIVDAWKALQGLNSSTMLELAGRLDSLTPEQLKPGRLKGLLFNEPHRFVTDLMLMLRDRAAEEEMIANPGRESIRQFLESATAWQTRHGFQNMWWNPRIHPALRTLNSSKINAILDIRYDVPIPPGASTLEVVQANLARIETYTTDLLAAIREALR